MGGTGVRWGASCFAKGRWTELGWSFEWSCDRTRRRKDGRCVRLMRPVVSTVAHRSDGSRHRAVGVGSVRQVRAEHELRRAILGREINQREEDRERICLPRVLSAVRVPVGRKVSAKKCQEKSVNRKMSAEREADGAARPSHGHKKCWRPCSLGHTSSGSAGSLRSAGQGACTERGHVF